MKIIIIFNVRIQYVFEMFIGKIEKFVDLVCVDINESEYKYVV